MRIETCNGLKDTLARMVAGERQQRQKETTFNACVSKLTTHLAVENITVDAMATLIPDGDELRNEFQLV